MKSRTSWPNSSRKYSASVRPVSPTRARAPGGSFICPKTSAVLSMTPDSFISSQSELPSRVRSPTPAKTENPLCSVAIFRINSMTMTVLPTPAPPNKAALLTAVDLERVVDLRQILPLEDDVDDGTDDLVDAAGSRLLRLFLFLFRFLRDCHWCLLAGGQRFGAAHDFAQFFGDGRLPHLVAQQRQVLDQLACIIGRVAHRDHLGRVEACQIVQHRGVDLRLDVPR